MNIINLTPHAVNIYTESGIKTIEPSGTVARCDQQRLLIGHIGDICLYKTSFGEVTGLPDSQEDTFFIVSAIVANAVKGRRSDVLIPIDPVRDEAGAIIGCRALAWV